MTSVRIKTGGLPCILCELMQWLSAGVEIPVLPVGSDQFYWQGNLNRYHHFCVVDLSLVQDVSYRACSGLQGGLYLCLSVTRFVSWL